ncbi:MAG TPA: HAMP domain-containing sensor histidine kinase [Candidatus Dojkabacteria bacterium]|nr:HAMP domain-containing sensor histidine kinase [Candidatus Dojkabacteria bacterium]
MSNRTSMKLEDSLNEYTLTVVKDLFLCTLVMSCLSLLLCFYGMGEHYYHLSCLFFLLAIFLFVVLKRRDKCGKFLTKMIAIFTPLLLLGLFLVDDFVISIKPLVYLYFTFFLIEIIRMAFLLDSYVRSLLKKQQEYQIVASFENRNRLLGKVSRSLLHDIATPVSILLGCLELSEGRKLSKIEREDLYTNVKIAVNQMDSILHSTDFLMKRSSSVESFSIDECIEEIVTLLRVRTDEACILVERNYHTKENITGDRNVFLRVFLNVFLNAIEELEKRKRDVRKISIKTSETPEFFTVYIFDNGDGFDSKLQRVFNNEEFIFSGKALDLGSGLVFVKYCVREIFNGDIKIENHKGEMRNCLKLVIPRD